MSDVQEEGVCDKCGRETEVVELTLSMFAIDQVCTVCLSKLEELDGD